MHGQGKALKGRLRAVKDKSVGGSYTIPTGLREGNKTTSAARTTGSEYVASRESETRRRRRDRFAQQDN